MGIFVAIQGEELVLVYNSEYSVLYSQTIRAGRITEMILSSSPVEGETEALGYYLVCPRSQSWFVAALGQEPNSSFQPVF